ncbi:MAG: hypothetical protein M1828_003758 [Chrysothrix sp. TS-e1954]|nr:MAG: hypothetical protein M1828_003758 [Chrysothrix sp. TS-e1954]
MLVARSFNYGPSSRSPTPPKRESEKTPRKQDASPVRGFGWRPSSFKETQKQTVQPVTPVKTGGVRRGEKGQTYEASAFRGAERNQSGAVSDQLMQQDASPKHSNPVAVPPASRSQAGAHAADRRHHGALRAPNRGSTGSEKLSPATAAILASTSIPKRKTFTKQRPFTSSARNVSIDKLVQEWKRSDISEPSSLGTSPTMELLLSSPEETRDLAFLEDEDDMETSDGIAFGSMPSRSISSTSIASLDFEGSSATSTSTPMTPSSYLQRRKRGSAGNSVERKPRSRSISQSIDSIQDHPLKTSATATDELSDTTEDESGRSSPLPSAPNSRPSSPPRRPTNRPQPARRGSSTKSNLTSSLQSLRSTITRSFANFAATPTVPLPPPDQLARGFGLIGAPPSYNPEMRPRPREGLPSPELRRYLNPHAFHLYGNRLDVTNPRATTSSPQTEARVDDLEIPLQSFNDPTSPQPQLPPRPSTTITSDLPTHADEIPAPPPSSPSLSYNHYQRREPRENPEFLRIALLEMSMRRAGKLEYAPFGASSGGRRSWWLPAREVAIAIDDEARFGGRLGRRRVPRRWVSVVV